MFSVGTITKLLSFQGISLQAADLFFDPLKGFKMIIEDLGDIGDNGRFLGFRI